MKLCFEKRSGNIIKEESRKMEKHTKASDKKKKKSERNIMLF